VISTAQTEDQSLNIDILVRTKCINNW